MDLRAEQPDDQDAVRDVHVRAFGDHGRKVVADIVDAVRAAITSGDGLSLVAADASRVVGHVMFTRGLLDSPRRLIDVQVLSPLAAVPGCQRQGIGSAPVRRGLELLADRSFQWCSCKAHPATTRASGSLPAASRASVSRRSVSPTLPSRRSGCARTSRR